MTDYVVGANITVSTLPAGFRDGTGALANASPVSLTVQKPDGTTVVYNSPTNVSTGQYQQILPLTDTALLGHYQYVWTGTVGGFVGKTFPDEFDVIDQFVTTVLSLQDAKDMLNISQTDTSSDKEIRAKISTIEAGLENATGGPLITSTITERVEVSSNDKVLVLRKRPVVGVTSITEIASGNLISLVDIDIDTVTGIVRRKLGWPFILWRGRAVSIVYTAGWGTAVLPAFAEAARIILAHLWSTQHGVASVPAPFGQGVDLVVVPGLGFAIPNMAADVLRPYLLEAYF